jgi:D-Tyr-tRNAtyr deacylase
MIGMIGLLQRVAQASVVVDGETVGAIGRGLMVLVCAEKGDTEREADACWPNCSATACFPTTPAR